MRCPRLHSPSILGLCGILLLSACAPDDPRVIMRNLRTNLARQYHACVPLGWSAQPVAGSYYPAYSAEYQDEKSWLAPLWLGHIGFNELRDPVVRNTYAVLNDLVHAGMLVRRRTDDGVQYQLTVRAIQYYFADNQYGDNRDALPYLCYSTIVPTHIAWQQPIHVERLPDKGDRRVFRAAFDWVASPIAPWAQDAIIRSHSVILQPAESPAVARFTEFNGDWELTSLYIPGPMLPKLADTKAWSATASH